VGIFPYIGLAYGKYLQFKLLKPLKKVETQWKSTGKASGLSAGEAFGACGLQKIRGVN